MPKKQLYIGGLTFISIGVGFSCKHCTQPLNKSNKKDKEIKEIEKTYSIQILSFHSTSPMFVI